MPAKNNNSIYCTKEWSNPISKGGSDYYIRGANRHVGVPKNILGRQEPHSGNAYAGICIRTKFIRRKYIEYVETKLIDTLIKDEDYLVEFYISRAERSIGSVKEFGVLFLKKFSWGLEGIGIATKPSVDFINPAGYEDKKNWIKFSAVYHAEGYETALILGYFNYDKSKAFKCFAHYYVDDVSVTLIEKKDDSIVSIKTEDSIPKLFSPKLGEIITLKNIFFMTNKSELLPQSFPELDKLIQYLHESPNTSIKISGHTDNTGNEEQNKTLSEGRAKAVADYLISKWIDKSRIYYIGYGSAKPITTNDTDDGKRQNRRVEFIISKN
jgi:outer membrane protein OmpA-like peptidoglycan-associated protein